MAPVTCLWWRSVHALSVRAKLMLLYLLVTLAGLLIFGLMSFGALQYALLQGKKTHLKGREDRLVSLLTENRAKGVTEPLSEQLRNYALVTHEGNLFHIHNLDGSFLFPSEGVGRDWALPSSDDCTQPVFNSVAVDKSSVLVMCHTILLDGRMVRLHIGGSLEEEAYILRTYRKALLLLMPGLLILSSISGYFLSRHALQPVDRMTRAALGIGIGNLSRRLPIPPAKDEIQDLAIAWNQLLARLEAAVSRLSQFSADASHDLRTSITVMLATAQLSLHRHRTEEEYRDALDPTVARNLSSGVIYDALHPIGARSAGCSALYANSGTSALSRPTILWCSHLSEIPRPRPSLAHGSTCSAPLFPNRVFASAAYTRRWMPAGRALHSAGQAESTAQS